MDRKHERSVSVEQGKEISKDLTFLECSAKTGENIPALGNIIVALAKKYVGSGIRYFVSDTNVDKKAQLRFKILHFTYMVQNM